MRWPLRALLGLSVLCLAAGCTSERHSLGNSSETENSASARVIRVDSLLAYRDRSDTSPTVATLRLDAGNFDFARVDSLGEEISIERPDGADLPYEPLFWDRSAKLARLRVRLEARELAPGGWIRMRWGANVRGWRDPLAVWDSLSGEKRLSLTSFLVDDFESGTGRSRLPDSSDWYASASDSATVSPLKFPAAGHGREGKAVAITYSANSNAGRYCLIGLKLGSKARNLRSLDSLVAYVRGSGEVAVALERPDSLHGTKAWKRMQLDTAWTRVRVGPEDFEAPTGKGGNVGWLAIRDSVTRLTFLVTGGSELWVDEIRLHGVDVDDFR